MAKRAKGQGAKPPKAASGNGRAAPKPRAPGLVLKLRATQRQGRAVTLRLSGLSYEQIGNELDIDTLTAWKLVNRAYESHAKQLGESIEQVREMELGKLDKMDSVLWGLLQDGGGELLTVESGKTPHGSMSKVTRKQVGIHGVVDRLLAVQQRRAALLGLDAATKYEHTGKDGGPIALEALSRIVQRGDALKALAEANAPKGKGKP